MIFDDNAYPWAAAARDKLAAERWQRAKQAYQDRQIDDTEFLEERRLWMENQKAFDAARGELAPDHCYE